jgi:histidyl-tRNA synthetase
MSKLQAVRGTQDMIGDAAARYDRVVDEFRAVSRLFGFRPVQVPVFEFTGVFARTLGETSDVVAKEMYSFQDRGGEGLTLRPEFTAGIARAFISAGWQHMAPLRLISHGPVFRYERPQKGRFRQFHQIDAEIIGSAEPAADVDLLAFAALLLDRLGIADGVALKLNTLGDAATRDAWRGALVAHFTANADALSADSRERLARNPLRILDSKAAEDRALIDAAPGIDAFLSSDAGAFFAAVQRGLEASGVAFVRDARLVRGLDYYRHTAFEFTTDRLGAQGTVLAGGRYDGLIGSMAGPDTPAVGWAGGIERLAMLLAPAAEVPIELSLVPADAAMETLGQRLLHLLRGHGIAADMITSGAHGKRYDRARKAGSARALMLQPHDGAIAAVRLRDLHVVEGKTTPVRDRVGRALRTVFRAQDGEIGNAFSWIIHHPD